MSKKIVLLYHRVAKAADDPHLLAVNPENFAAHVHWLKTGNIKMLVDITFDDGYADNLYNALPILKKYQTPASIFVTSGYINKTQPFSWDKKTRLGSRGRPMTREELIRLAKNPLIRIGSHTVTHPRLSNLTKAKQLFEIEKSKLALERIVKKNIATFSYPFGSVGDFDARTIACLKKTGYIAAYANWPGHVDDKTDQFKIPRYLVRNWELAKFKSMFNSWV